MTQHTPPQEGRPPLDPHPDPAPWMYDEASGRLASVNWDGMGEEQLIATFPKENPKSRDNAFWVSAARRDYDPAKQAIRERQLALCLSALRVGVEAIRTAVLHIKDDDVCLELEAAAKQMFDAIDGKIPPRPPRG